MKPPAKIDVAGTPYEITWDETAINRAMVAEAEHLLGRTDANQQQIAIQPNQGAISLRRTLLHELLHAIWDVAGLHATIDVSAEEPVIRGLEAPLLETLRRNPKLIAFLLAE